MSTTFSNPQISAAFVSQVSQGAAPAVLTGTVSNAAANSPTVGTAAGNVNKRYQRNGTVTTGTPLDLDLTALTDDDGAALSFATLRGILLTCPSNTTVGQNFSLGAGSNPVFAAALPFTASGGVLPGFIAADFRDAPITVDGTHKILRITVAAGTAVPFNLALWGT